MTSRQLGLAIAAPPQTEAEAAAERAEIEADGDEQALLYEHLVVACRAVARELGYDACANAIEAIWADRGHPVSSSVLRAALNPNNLNHNYFRFEWAIWFARKSDAVAELLLEIGGRACPKKSPEDELRDLKAAIREELPKRAAADPEGRAAVSQYVGDITFFDLCPACGRRFDAATRLVLNLKLDEHVPACEAAAKKKLELAAHALRQGDLFGGE